MSLVRFAFAAACALVIAGPAAAAAPGRAGFVVTLGRDTTSLERVTRTANRLEVEQVTRAPRVLRRHYVYQLDAKGMIRDFTMVTSAPGAAPDAPPIQRIEGRRTADSVITEVRSGANVRTLRAALPDDGVLISVGTLFPTYEQVVRRLVRSKADTLGTPVGYIGTALTGWLSLARIGRDSVAIHTSRGDLFHARVDREGRVLSARPLAGTAQYTAARVAKLDLEGLAASWVAAEQASGAMGALSVRDTVKASARGAELWVDYGRPSKRGREVFGALVPWNEVWRTGANAATQFRTDRALDIGDSTLPPGTYTLWTVPSPSGWKLMVNSETGQWGTDYKSEKDVLSVPMRVTTLPSAVERFTISIEPTADGGELRLEWDTTRAAAAFKVAAD
jgi:hypothetical protein